ncbi:hypothetical protein FD03_GL001436 [Companilactobacillus nodensis DSM 19682 = JCM 14932 = NBRC 107160]|uniref:Extracellular protein n=2 Tax=Companilactobacillus nodensis TaxID=460870 RepID=A0A0R1KF56_9LACO|nr:hypothetical protein FD03_GL001436 [Companilactobacillus nodensis DSM 19682 = JCM 14932 = NBRC 107160]
MPIILFTLFIFFGNVHIVHAENGADQTNRLNAPAGLSLEQVDDGYFTVGDFGATNSATVNPSDVSKGEISRPDEVRLTNDNNQLSSIWSNVDNGNYLDITHKQKMSMWLYFGNKGSSGDGMALVLQNGGIDAISRKNDGTPSPGETLGVWASDSNGAQSSRDELAKTAIQNSWALEFDTFKNVTKTPVLASGFDVDLNGLSSYSDEHIAWNYPAEGSTYNQYGSGPNGYYYSMNHEDAREKLHLTTNNYKVNSGQAIWHHLTVEYTPPVTKGSNLATLKYTFNDKNPDGSQGSNIPDEEFSKTVQLDLSKFHLNGNTKLRYGFTGSTGTVFAENMAVFETMPSLVEAESNVVVNDATQGNREIADGGKNVHDGDKMNFNYNVTYDSGEKDLADIKATISLPGHMTYASSGQVGTVSYADGSKSEPIDASEIKDGVLTHTLARSLNNGLNTAQIQLNGVAKIDQSNGADVSTKVASTHTDITGNLYSDDVYTPSFTIDPVTTHLTLSAINPTISVYPGDKFFLNGQYSYDDGTAVDNTKMHYYVNVDGTHDYSFGDTDSFDGYFSIYGQHKDDNGNLVSNFPQDDFSKGKHTITVYAMDDNYIVSKPVTYTVDVQTPKPVLSVDGDSEINTTLSAGNINLPVNLTYDDKYGFDSSDVTWHTKVQGTGVEATTALTDGSANPKTSSKFVQTLRDSDLKIDKAGKYTLTAYVTDKNGQSSESITFTVIVRDKTASLTYRNSYSFGAVNASDETVYDRRSGDWTLGVNTTESDWSLSATASDLKSNEGSATLNGNLEYIDNDGNSQSMKTKTFLGEDKNVTSDKKDISGSWKDESHGILLKVMPNPVAGGYTGTISWDLTNSL